MAEPVEKVSIDQLMHFIDLWANDARSRVCLRKVRWYAVCGNGRAIALDNATNNCWNEEFINEEEAIKWLESPSLSAVDGMAVDEE